MIGLETEIGAWTLDETCLVIGRQIEKELDDGKKPFEEKFADRKSGYSSVTIKGAKKMKIPENGVW